MLVIPALPKGRPAVIITKLFFFINFIFLIISLDIDIISFQLLASLLLIDLTPHSKETCLLTFIFGDIVRILTAGLIAEISFADLPELEKTITALTLGL